MDKKYTKQTFNKRLSLFDIRIYDETSARYALEDDLICETEEETSFKAKVIFDEIKKGNMFTIAESDGTRTTYRIATENDIKTEPLYRKMEDEFVESFLTDEDKEKINAIKEFIMNLEEKDAILDSME